MNRKELKAIIDAKRKDNKTYQQIADELNIEYGIVMSRQSIYGIYKRNENKENDEDGKAIEEDAIEFWMRLQSYTETHKNIQEHYGKSIAFNRIKNIIQENELVCKQRRRELTDRMAEELRCGADMQEIEEMSEYKGVRFSKDKLAEITAEAYSKLVRLSARDIIAYVMTRDDIGEEVKRAIVTRIISDYSIENLSYTILKNSMAGEFNVII